MEDLDITSSGPLLTPEPKNGDLIRGGKPGRLYLLDRASMGLKQTFKAGSTTRIFSCLLRNALMA
jgi:hypothetical protein